MSDFGKQLLEKQKLKFQYNIHERQLRNYYKQAKQQKGNTGDNLVFLLESRLDATVMRAGFAPTIYAARQLVRHGHVSVNGRKVDLPGFQLQPNDSLVVKEASRAIPFVQEAVQSALVPPYLQLDKDAFQAKVLRTPTREEIPVICEIPLVVEMYSR